ncbi:MAG: DsrE family protein [Gammaproteobacteria bacterium]|nr:DsrE family protein [Gammaproteobacteria bacterium]
MSTMKQYLSTTAVVLYLLTVPGSVAAGPEDPSSFEPVDYGAQRVLYDWNYPTPESGLRALGFVRNHIKALEEFGDLEASDIVIVAHGNDLHAFSRHNRAAFPEAYDALKELADKGVKLRICRNAARSRGYDPDDFYDLFTVVPAAVIDIAMWQNRGYSYMYPELFARMTRDELREQHPEIEMSE